jgi:hypothetical protein
MRYLIPATVLALGLGLSACNQSASTPPAGETTAPVVVTPPGPEGPPGPPGAPGTPGAPGGTTVVTPPPAPAPDTGPGTKVTVEKKY